MGNYENSAGLSVRNHYGPKIIDEGTKFGGQVSTSGMDKQAEWVVSYDDIPVLTDVALGMETLIPAGAAINKVSLQVLEAFVGGTSYDIGLMDAAGVAINADGFWDLIVTADINVVNEWRDAAVHAGTDSGALIEATAPITSDGYLVMLAAGTFTAGRMRILVEFTQADTDATGNYVAGGVKGDGT